MEDNIKNVLKIIVRTRDISINTIFPVFIIFKKINIKPIGNIK